MRDQLLFLTLAIAMTVSVASATTWTVLPDSTGDAPTIQAGIDSASAGDTVMVMCGTYNEYDINMKSGVHLTSETGVAGCAQIDAGGLGRGLICDGIGNAAIVGLTVTGGAVTGLNGGGMFCRLSDVTVTNCGFHSNSTDRRGGGVFVNSCSPVFTNCDFISNVAESGEDCEGAGACVLSGEPTFDGCTFEYNVATYGDGGGLYCRYGGGSPLIIGCTFKGNRSDWGGGLALATDGGNPEVHGCMFSVNNAGSGGGLGCANCGVTVTGCTFEDNSASFGGGLHNIGDSLVTVSDCIFVGNVAGTMASMGGAFMVEFGGSAIYTGCEFIGNTAVSSGGAGQVVYNATATVDSCVFAGNQATGDSGGRVGGAVAVRVDSYAGISRCTIYGNSAVAAGGGVSFRETSTGTLDRCIIAYSDLGEAVDWDETGAEPALSCCDLFGNAGGDWVGPIADQYGVDGNISEDPLFCDPDSGDLTLEVDSPCSPDYSPEGCGLIGARYVGCGESGVITLDTRLSHHLNVAPAVPDPFRDRTEIRYVIPPDHDMPQVVVSIYDIAGRRVKTLLSAGRGPGVHTVVWDASDHSGTPVASGVYFCRVCWNGRSQTRRLVVLR